MFASTPMVASPTYDRCGTLLRDPIAAFLVSTNVPILPATPRSVPGRRKANGPTDAPAPITAEDPWVRTTDAPSPIVTSVSVVSGPTAAPAPIEVRPRSCVPGSISASTPIVTVTSIQVVAG